MDILKKIREKKDEYEVMMIIIAATGVMLAVYMGCKIIIITYCVQLLQM